MAPGLLLPGPRTPSSVFCQAEGMCAGLPGAAVHPSRGEEAGEQPHAGGFWGRVLFSLVLSEPLPLPPGEGPVKSWWGLEQGTVPTCQAALPAACPLAGPALCPSLALVLAGAAPHPHRPTPAPFMSQIHLCRKKVASRSCHFYNNTEGKGVRGSHSRSQVGLERVLPPGPCGLLALRFGAPDWPHWFSEVRG